MRRIEFFLPMKPPTITAQEHQIAVVKGKPVFYKPRELVEAETKLMAYLGQHKPDKPLKGAVRLITKWCFAITGKHTDGEYKTTKPDTDNLQKLLKDCMENLKYYKNDAQVASEITEKFWAEIPGIYIKLEELEGSIK